ncbi:hypothetical protein EIP91_005129 [Steccherinum ochraceum]|uniref:Uncharacterized protein n=1 Tax=Steccherinum ochraceum TaxID=92696 RepID=A0A4R0RFZ5_9APHY|nr:hypothetical protein EIP91_005129 [Steccherinum ochraceum]
MTVASRVHRALATTSTRNPLITASARSSKRDRIPSRNIATLAFPHDDAPSAFDIQIFDIFDAPSRLGESSKLLRRESAPAQTAQSVRSIHSSARTERVARKIQPLPTAVLYDGPARPKHLSMIAYRAPRCSSPRSGTEEGHRGHTLPSPLPPPVMFDGPSRLRPYARGGVDSESSSASASQTAILISGVGLALYAGSELYKTKDRSSRGTDSVSR